MKQRESNFESLRIVAMMMVVLLHCNYFVLGDVNASEISTSPVGSFWRMFWDQLCTPCVNLFILISGWFGIRPKFNGGISLLFQVVFYTLLSIIICILIGWEISFDRIKAAITCQMGYWFVLSYLLLYITAPALNLLVEKEPQMSFSIVMSLLTFEFALDWIVYYAGGGGGKSYVAFLTLYLIGRMLSTRVLRVRHWSKPIFLMLFFIFSLIPTVIAYFGEIFLNFQLGKSAYTNPFVIAASIALTLYFSKLHFNSKIVNWLACSSFSIYLLHMNPLIANHFKNIMLSVFHMCGNHLLVYSLTALLLTLALGFLCICVDKFRLFLWSKISLRISQS